MDRNHIAQDHTVRESACRELVPVDADRGSQGTRAAPRIDAGFLALLLAHKMGAQTTRGRRRAAPGVASLAYAQSAALACRDRPAAHSLRMV